MTKVLKKLVNIVGYSLEWVLIICILFAFLIRTSTVQTYIAKQATSFLSKELHTKFEIEKVDIILFDQIYLEHVHVKDLKGRDLVKLQSLRLEIESLRLAKNELVLKEVVLKEGRAWVCIEKEDGNMNFQFLADYFSSDTPKKNTSPFGVTLNTLTLEETDVRYDDFRQYFSEYGLDYDHLYIRKLNTSISHFYNKGPLTKLTIENFATKDRSGLHIKDLKGSIEINDKGLKITNIDLTLNSSHVLAKEISYSVNNKEDLKHFNDKVHWVMDILPSKVNLGDVAFFVPELRGMNENIEVSGKVGNVLNHLKIENLSLKVGKKTRILADLELPDFTNLAAYDFKENIKKAHIDLHDLEKIKLPKNSGNLNLGSILSSLDFIKLKSMKIYGIHGKLRFEPTVIHSGKGTVQLQSALVLDEVNGKILGHAVQPDSVLLNIHNLLLGEIIGVSEIGTVNGKIGLNTFLFEGEKYEIADIKGKINDIQYDGYNYRNILLKEVDIKDELANVDIVVNDPNLMAEIQGDISLSEKPNYDLKINLETAKLGGLGYTKSQKTDLAGSFEVKSQGNSMDDFSANVQLEEMWYDEDLKRINVPKAKIDYDHSLKKDVLNLSSSLADISLTGTLDFETVQADLEYGISRVLPSIIKGKKPKKGKVDNIFDLEIKIKNMDQFTAIFIPELAVAKQTKANISFNGRDDFFSIQMNSDQIMYDSLFFDNVTLTQRVNDKGVLANLDVKRVSFTDSLFINDVSFVTTGLGGNLNSILKWEPNTLNQSQIKWQTLMMGPEDMSFLLDRSNISLNGYKWYISSQSEIQARSNDLYVENFLIQSERKNQKIEINGCLSKNLSDELLMNITNIDLEDISKMLKLDLLFEGKLTGNVALADPYKTMKLGSKLDITGFYLDKQEVGNITMNAHYNMDVKSIGMKGELAYRGLKSMDFSGQYFVEKTEDNLQMRLDFNQTDIAFTNAFMDPDVVGKIEGKLNGFIDVKGTPDVPKLKGNLFLQNAAATIEMLGCRYSMNGKVIVEEDGFFINKLPIKDKDGNIASLDGAVLHDNFAKFNYNVDIDFEDDYAHTYSENPSGKIDKFLVLNTSYKEGDYYYGKAYGVGTANISGYDTQMDITVNAQTRKGTKVIFPMYGSNELEEDEDLIRFINKNKIEEQIKERIDFTGVNLEMSFNITPDAEMRLVFNEQTQDEIKAYTQGLLILKLDAFNQMSLEGNLSIVPGSIYNFTMGLYRKPFEILAGSSLHWSGNVYQADMNIITSYDIKNVNILELSPDQTDKTLQNQEVKCLLKLTDKLDDPSLSFEIISPNAPESGKVLVNKVNEDKDELNRQFFSLMLFNKFQPLKGNVSADGSAAFDLFESQINAALSQLSKSYQVKMDLGSTNLSTSVQKSFLNDRLILTGSFGVESGADAEESMTNGLVGDVSVEYLVNEKGTFRVNAFNKSNTNTVNENAGPFTQGAGLSYHEDFNNWKDFVLFQSFLDVFRSREEKVVKERRKKRQTKIPEDGINNGIVPNIENLQKNEKSINRK